MQSTFILLFLVAWLVLCFSAQCVLLMQSNENVFVRRTPDPSGTAMRLQQEMSESMYRYIAYHLSLFFQMANLLLSSTTPSETSSADMKEAKLNLKSRMDSFTVPQDFNFDVFRQVLNGFFQAEGHISCRIRSGSFIPFFSLNQLYTKKSLNFFLLIWHVLGRQGSLHLYETPQGKLVITYTNGSWNHILTIIKEYFNNCYGDKYTAFSKLEKIYELSRDKSPSSLSLAIHLAYTLTTTGASRDLTLSEQLSSLNLTNIPTPVLPEFSRNLLLPTIPFLVGFILGDGTFYIRLNPRGMHIRIVPNLFLPQVNTPANVEFLGMLQSYLSSLGAQSSIQYYENMVRLEVGGFISVFDVLVKVFTPYAQYFYWKSHQFELIQRVAKLVLADAHTSYYGMKMIIDMIFSLSVARIYPIEHWYGKLETSFNAKGESNSSGHYFILSPANLRSSGWRVAFPKKCKANDPSSLLVDTTFLHKDSGGSDISLQNAIAYRDSQIKLWVDSIVG